MRGTISHCLGVRCILTYTILAWSKRYGGEHSDEYNAVCESSRFTEVCLTTVQSADSQRVVALNATIIHLSRGVIRPPLRTLTTKRYPL